jgi:hypothetical protein
MPWVLAAAMVAVIAIPGPAAAQAPGGGSDPLTGTGVWIWHVARSDGGTPQAIAARAHAANVTTLIIKAAHGPVSWPQFSPELIAALKSNGLRVCAYQRLLGRRPLAEADAAVRAIRAGADCFVIDAEIELEGRYREAQAYMTALRGAVGPSYPVALTSFPYADLHQRFPYSVFLGPGGAQFNLPQIYWKALRAPVAAAFARTYLYNALYGRPIRPLGQLWNRPSPAQVLAFRHLASTHGAAGLSWWNWEQAQPTAWPTLAAPVPAGLPAAPAYPTVRRGARGDMVLWAKARLRRLGRFPSAGNVFDSAMQADLIGLQSAAGLAPTGALDAPTWSYLLAGGTGDQQLSAARAYRRARRS